MLILLPPSEGKTAPRRGKPLNLAALTCPELTDARRAVIDALVDLCSGDVATAAGVLEVGATQHDLVALNAGLADAPTARADAVYSGVVYDALDAHNFKQSLKLCDAALKKAADTSMVKALKAVTLERMGRTEEGLKLARDVASALAPALPTRPEGVLRWLSLWRWF